MNLPNIEDAGDITGQRVLVRADLNAPLVDGKVNNSFRLDKMIPTIDLLRHKKAKVILFSHITKNDQYDSLYPMYEYLNGFFPVKFCPTYFTPEAVAMVADLEDGEVLLFENIRVNPGEDENDLDFAKKLAAYGDIYVNEAFSESHRSAASIVSLPTLLPHYAGSVFISEVEQLSKAFTPEHPFLFILGGAKFETKLPLVEKFLKTADDIFIGGKLAAQAATMDVAKNPKLILPVGDITALDANQETLDLLKPKIDAAKFILWNGPLGFYEKGYVQGSEGLAKMLVESGAEVILGGGDTLTAIQALNILEKFSFVSTGGGAMLDFLANETLPGIEALTK